MSRIGKKPLEVPKGVTVTLGHGEVTVKGPKGTLNYKYDNRFKVEQKDNVIKVMRPTEDAGDMAKHGLIRSLIKNMMQGVLNGYKKELEIRGVGFKAQVQGKKLTMQLGYSHPVVYMIPDGITISAPKATQIVVEGIDKSKIGEVAAEIREFYLPEPYKGKGIRYFQEYVRHKAGKTVA